MTPTRETQQRLAVSALIAEGEEAIQFLPRAFALDMVKVIAAVRRAFSDQPSNVVQVGDHTPEPMAYLPVPNPGMGGEDV